MIGFVIKSGKCNVIPELSLYDTTHDLYEILNNIPYSQGTCCFCLNSFLNGINTKKDYNKDTDGLNMDWFKSRIIVLKCNHIFHLCCFTKYIKHNYNEYIFANVEIDIVNESENNDLNSSLPNSLCSSENNDLNSRLSNSLCSSENNIKTIESKTSNCSSENNIKTIESKTSNCSSENNNKSEILSDLYDNLEQKTNNKIIWNKFLKKIINKEISDYCNGENISNNSYDNALCDIKIYRDFLVNNNKLNENVLNDNKLNENVLNENVLNENVLNDNKSNDNKSNENVLNNNNELDNIKSYYETENSINTSINSNCFRVECPLCKKKVNSFCTSSILEKYKILLELYS